MSKWDCCAKAQVVTHATINSVGKIWCAEHGAREIPSLCGWCKRPQICTDEACDDCKADSRASHPREHEYDTPSFASNPFADIEAMPGKTSHYYWWAVYDVNEPMHVARTEGEAKDYIKAMGSQLSQPSVEKMLMAINRPTKKVLPGLEERLAKLEEVMRLFRSSLDYCATLHRKGERDNA